MPHSEKVQEQMRLLAEIAELYKASLMLCEETLGDSVRALSEFMGGYAFERQGRSPAYGPMASDVVKRLARRPGFWQDRDSPKKVWTLFEKTLQQRTRSRSNPKNNPLCFWGYAYKDQRGCSTVKGLSAIEFVQRHLGSYEHNIVLWAKCQLDQDQARAAHYALCSINGIGPKIASFFLRDVAWSLKAYPDTDRALLQPVDVWVKRATYALDQESEGKEAEWIVAAAREMDVLPEAINAAMWYFGAVVAGSEYSLSLAMDSIDTAYRMVDEYVERVARQMRAWPEVRNAKP